MNGFFRENQFFVKHRLLWALAVSAVSLFASAAEPVSPEARLEQLKKQFPEEAAMGIPMKLKVDMPNPVRKNPAEGKMARRPAFRSQLVSPAKDFRFIGKCNLLVRFTLDKPVAKTLWQSVCDDQMADVWVNGRHVEHELWSTQWAAMDSFPIPAEYFVTGENTLAITYLNTGDIGGLMTDLQLLLTDDTFLVITLDQAVGFCGNAPEGWQKPGFDSSAWAPVAKRPGPPARPWTGFNPKNYRSIQVSGETVEVKLLERKKVTADVRFSCKKGFRGDETFSARLCLFNGQPLREFAGTAKELNGTVNKDGSIDFHFCCFNGEYYGAPVKMYWEFGVVGGKVQGDLRTDFVTDGEAAPGAPLVSKIARTGNGPIPMVNGKPFYFNVLTVHSYSDPLSKHTGMEGEGSPFNTIALRLGSNSNETNWWLGPDKYDFTGIDRSINVMFQRFPGCKLAPHIWCHPGNWYRTAYPERISLMEDGSQHNYYVAPVSFCNQDARRDAEKAVRALVEHIEKYFGSRTLLYNLMGGISCEWQGWAAQANHYADYSKYAIRDFEEYAAKNGMPTKGIPGRKERETSMDGVFRSPKKDALAILYSKHYSDTISEFVELMARVVKDVCRNNKLVGAYYGYHMEHSNMIYSVNGAGHNNLQRLLDSPNVDFFLSPQSYGIRSYGAPNADMKPYGAIREAGKLSMIEDDTRTHLTFRTGYEQTPNLDMTLNILKRNVGMALSRNVPLNHLPLVGGNELAHPAVRAMFNRSIQVGQYLLEHASDPSAEIAAVIDEEAVRYLAVDRREIFAKDRDRYRYNANGELQSSTRRIYPVSGDLLYYQRIPLAQIGAPVDMIMLSDVAKFGKKYKMVIFLNSFKDTPALRNAIRYLRDNHVTTVFTYGAGFIDDNGISPKTLSEGIGMKMAEATPGNLRIRFADGSLAGQDYDVKTRFQVVDETAVPLAKYADNGKVAVAKTKTGKTYFYGTTDLDHNFLQDVARSAGVFFFSDTKDNVFASKDIVSIHAAGGGRKTIHLPKVADVVEIYSGKVVARQTNTFQFDMKPFETKVFLYGKLEDIQQAVK